ncbi:MAG: hypothetical protein ACM31H_03820 [Nitrososphaerales archaeon]
MKVFKMIAPKNQELYDLMIDKITELFYLSESQGEFYCFKSKNSMLISNNYLDYQSWKEQAISVTQFLTITAINGELGNMDFPAWINNQYIMGYHKTLKVWIKIVFSHIGDNGFYDISGTIFDTIAEYDLNHIGMDMINTNAIDYENINQYDISMIPGIGYEKKFET